MNNIRKWLSMIIIFAILLIQVSAFTVRAAADPSAYALAYSVNADGKTVTVTGFAVAPTAAYNLVIPRKVVINNIKFTVTEIGANAFAGISGAPNTLLSSVSFPNTLTKIGASAFYYCQSTLFTSLRIPKSVTTIGAQAFRQCSKLKSIGILPETITSLGNQSFADLTSLNSGVNVPGGATLDTAVFKSSAQTVTNPVYYTVGEGATKVTDELFRYGNYVKEIILPNTCSSISASGIIDDKSLEQVYILADSVSISGTQFSTATLGNITTRGSTVFNVSNETVKASLIAKQISANNITVFNDFKIVLNAGLGDRTILSVAKDTPTIVLPEPTKNGYKFVGWYDAKSLHFAGENYNVSKSMVLTAVWDYDSEAQSALYKDVSSKNATNNFNTSPVRRIICESLAYKTIEVALIDADGEQTKVNVLFDKNGVWVNYDDDTPYKSVIMPSGYSYDNLIILSDVEVNYSVEIGLREPTIICMPRLSGDTKLSDFSWLSSDVTVANVSSDGYVTGHKSGNTQITVSYNNLSLIHI